MSSYLLTNARIASMDADEAEPGTVSEGAIAISQGRIAWIGSRDDLPSRFSDWPDWPLEGRLVTPGLIDCHTHLVAGGNRSEEFGMRLRGASYEEIAKAGGGILSTVRATRAADEEELLQDALRRVDALIADGVTTVEIKSGYGLDLPTELKMLRVARRIGTQRPIRVVTSFLGAHATPPEFAGKEDEYLDTVCLPALRAAHEAGLADAVDAFCESIAFMPAQIERLFDNARKLGLPLRLHAEQLSNLGGATLAARYGALSADHLEYVDMEGIQAMARAGTVAVLLPGAYYSLRETKTPPIGDFRAEGVAMAVATDCNPGSSPIASLLTVMNMACVLFRMTVEETLAGVTIHAARALGIADAGRIAPGCHADLAIWNADNIAELSCRIGTPPLWRRIFAGVPCRP